VTKGHTRIHCRLRGHVGVSGELYSDFSSVSIRTGGFGWAKNKGPSLLEPPTL
jgi:hypothetical protein